MMNDPIVEEVHRTRARMLARFGGDLQALMHDAQQRTEAAAKSGRRVVPMPPRRPRLTAPARKVG
jgi:hypothetical protein